MKTDYQIKNDVLDELAWQPNIDETQIGVIVENGVVTLSGVVNTYTKKLEAEKAAKRVEGVKAVALDIEVKYGADFKKTDKEIAKAIVEAFESKGLTKEDALLNARLAKILQCEDYDFQGSKPLSWFPAPSDHRAYDGTGVSIEEN